MVDHPLVQHKLTLMRRAETSTGDFRQLLREISLLLAYEVTRSLPTELVDIDTPIAPMRAPALAGKKLCFVSVLRAGNGILEGMLDLVPSARVGHLEVVLHGGEGVGFAVEPDVPDDVQERDVIVVDPMLATGNSAIAAVRRLKTRGCRSLKYVCLVAAPEGLAAFGAVHADVPIFTAAIDRKLDEHGYIVPGLGDAGDRLFGTK